MPKQTASDRPRTRQPRESNKRASGTLLESIFSNTQILLAYLDADFNFVRVNRAYSEADGRPLDFFPGKNHFDLYPNAENKAIFQEVLESGQPRKVFGKPFEYPEHPERGVSYWDWTLEPIKGPNGRVAGLLLSLINVTDRVHAEQARRDSEFKLRAIFDSMYQFMGLLDTNGILLEANSAALQFAGLQRDDVIGKPFWEAYWWSLCDETRNQLKAAIARSVQNAEFIRYEVQVRGAGDRIATIDFSLRPIKDAAGRVIYLVPEGRDITERKEIEKSLRQSEEKIRRLNADLEQRVNDRTSQLLAANQVLQQEVAERKRVEERLLLQSTALENAGNAIVITDRDGTIIWVNPAFTRLTGYSREEAIGGNPRLLKSGKHDRAFYEAFWAHLRSGRTWHGEMINRRKDGVLYVEEMTIAPVRQANGEITHFTAIKQDITERKRAEEEIQRLNAGLLRRTEALAAANRELEAFAYSVSHDLRAPLHAIEGFSQLLGEHAPQLDENGHRYLELIRANVAAVVSLVEDLLKFSRTSSQPMNKQRVNMTALVHQAVETLRHEQKERKVEIDVGELPECEGDPTLLEQVWVNLISNALKYTRKRESAKVSIGFLPGAIPPGKANGSVTSGAYFVKDNGVGFDLEQATNLFGLFQRFHREEEYEGTGVGLAIVQRIIHRHGGNVWAEAQVDEGATFCFTV